VNHQLGVIGGGNMAEAIVRGALSAGVLDAKQVIVADPVEARRAVFAELGVAVADQNRAIIADSRRILLAVKPQAVEDIADDLATVDGKTQCIISIMAGIPIGKLTEMVGDGARVVRVMPNTPLLVGLGMSGIAAGPGATDEDAAFAMQLFGAAGKAEQVDEPMLDAVTALSGSGPAYLFHLAEAMAEAGRAMGMDAAQADRLARQTLLGAATLLSRSDESAADLRRRVTSPGGTTQAAIEHLDQQNVKAAIIEAIQRAEARSRELGK